MSDSLTIAQMTDVHLGPIVGFSPRYWNMKRAIGFINWRKNRRHAYSQSVLDRIVADLHAQRPDHIAITGDLVNIGLPEEIEAAAAWLRSVGTPDRVSVIPGNHDIYSHIGADAGVNRWAGFMASTSSEFATDEADFPFVRRIGKIALVGLNSAVKTRPFMAHGRLGPAQLRRLDTILRATSKAGLFRLVMIHHPPLPGQAPASRGLHDAPALAKVLSDAGAELVIHGHNHRNMTAALPHGNRSIPVIGAPSAALGIAHRHEPLARYNLYRISPGEGPARIELIGRGLAIPDGPIIELERRMLRVD
jgi:3',5'-cyclic AMP phosphodiesterase CpdA